MDKQEVWQSVLAQIKLLISPANFNTWFKNTEVLEIENEKILLSVPNSFIKEWFEQKYHQMILKVVKSIHPQIKEIEYVIGKTPPSLIKKQIKRIIFPQPELLTFEIDEKTGLNPKYTFSNFVVGSFNELSYAAAQAIVEAPGKIYNPLFIYGGVGLGKTHLLQAIGNFLYKNKKMNVIYFQSNKLVEEIINAIKNNTIEELKKGFKDVEILILDDVQFLSGKEKTQEEFFFIFNYLYEKNRQIVLSSDRPAKVIPSLAERLKSRFEGGMIADISLPDYESRVAILKVKSQEKNINLQKEVLEYIASNIKNNIRELEGALNILSTFSKFHKKEITLETAKKLLKNIISPIPKISTFKKILKIVSEFYDVKEEDILSNLRRKEILKPRHIIMYLLRNEMNYSYPAIAQKFGGKDHTTVIHACEKIKKELLKNDELSEEINQLKIKIFEKEKI
jgi:chromosomal replication initiator protein